jgi:hypothetical protein
MSTGGPENEVDSNDESLTGFSRAAASKFSAKWAGTIDEQQNSQAFWQDFFREVIGVKDLQEAGIEFEKKVVSSKKGTTTRIDVYWRETLLVEQKSAGKDLDGAEVQAREYVVSLPPAQRPPIIIVCDFARFRIVDILLNKSHEFPLDDLSDNLQHIEAIAKRDSGSATLVQVEADQKAAKLMANLYLQLEKYGYSGHEASVFMVRVLFCLFADDTRMWSGRLFQKLVEDTNSEGTDLGPRIANLFALLDTPKNDRKGPLDPFMVDFPYVNGGIFAERIEVINFNGPMRAALIDCCNYDWSKINPTIFGALFQNIKSKDDRRALGEHYTTEANIEKVIRPLFLDELNEKLEKAWDSESKLRELQRELGSYKIFDPACGCGNFLITSYKRLRQLELDILVRLKQLQGTAGQTSLLDVKQDLFVNLEQLYGIEYVEWSSQIAKVAVYLADHQENLKLESVIGVASNRFPLTHAASIVQGNALEIEWAKFCPMSESTLIVGNPPFLGARLMNDQQRADQSRIWKSLAGSGMVDYVSNWFILASELINASGCKAALVSTNSITQGEQPALLWSVIGQLNVEINFAHRTFAWENDASGSASVHCVILGLSRRAPGKSKTLWDYPQADGEAIAKTVKNINAYLVDGNNVLVRARKSPLLEYLPPLLTGNEPRDGGHLSRITASEADEIRATDPIAAKYLRVLIGSQEVLNGTSNRFCLWLLNAEPNDVKNSAELQRRIRAVRENRLGAGGTKSAKTKTADTPALFSRIAQPATTFMAVPSVSSEKRQYIPLEFFEPDIIVNNAIFFIESTDMALYATLQSRIYRIWVEAVSSRLKSDYQISASSVYNTFPFPELDAESRAALVKLGNSLQSSRRNFENTSLGDLYDPILMPSEILKIHRSIDRELLRTLKVPAASSDSEILSELFNRYEALSEEGALL